MRFVDKSALVLKEHTAPLEPAPPAAHTQALSSDESIALVEEVTDAVNQNGSSKSENSGINPLLNDESNEVPNSVALLEDILPGVNEQDIRHENEVLKLQEIDEETREEVDAVSTVPVTAARAAKYAKLVREQATANALADETNRSGTLAVEQRYHLRNTAAAGRGFTSTLEQISSNAGSIIITSLCAY
ncbi:unnamed protein product [Ceratitis capitata]|uniref:(Mediterranean fruit fly) hypothetical protein n=1 Tax=Ceratitis capitata TaxID=7213 RepID=A0A811UHM8_CERCA|nr:unnamed protein product [Ceratitis capitata]